VLEDQIRYAEKWKSSDTRKKWPKGRWLHSGRGRAYVTQEEIRKNMMTGGRTQDGDAANRSRYNWESDGPPVLRVLKGKTDRRNQRERPSKRSKTKAFERGCKLRLYLGGTIYVHLNGVRNQLRLESGVARGRFSEWTCSERAANVVLTMKPSKGERNPLGSPRSVSAGTTSGQSIRGANRMLFTTQSLKRRFSTFDGES